MYVGCDFDVTDAAEREPYTLDFVNDLPAGAAIASATADLAVVSGTDASPALHLYGSVSISGTKVTQMLSGLVNGVNYRLTLTVTTDGGAILDLWSHVASKTPR